MAKAGFLATILLAVTWLLTAGAGSAAAQNGRVRVTSSSEVVRYAGWEKGLIKRDPTLKHWAWIPIDSYRYHHVATPIASGPRKSIYVKPIHVNAVSPSKRRHSNPYVHIETRSTLTNADVSARLRYGGANQDGSASLAAGSVNGQLASAPRVSTYSDAYGRLSASSNKRGSLLTERKSVYGRVKGF
jgi:hypothetical protein